MNYFAHGLRYLDQPYFVAGTAVPDWLNVVDRKVRARGKSAAKLTGDPDPRFAQVARGIVRHHADDRWFHQTRAFAELSLELTVRIRDRLAPDHGFRPSFLGHILVEILLDAELIRQTPERLDRYYEALREVHPPLVAEVVDRVAARPAVGLSEFIPAFCRARFLYDYAEDGKLLPRLNRVMRRVGLPELPPAFVDFLAEARPLVAARRLSLLTEPDSPAGPVEPEVGCPTSRRGGSASLEGESP
jgi:hypothetical protein